jgi:hypothetical protein
VLKSFLKISKNVGEKNHADFLIPKVISLAVVNKYGYKSVIYSGKKSPTL